MSGQVRTLLRKIRRLGAQASKRGQFDWHEEDASVFRRPNELPMEAFARHVSALGLHEGVERSRLIALYVEFLEANDARPIDGWGRWDRELGRVGFLIRRSSRPGRPRLYFAPRPVPARVSLVDTVEVPGSQSRPRMASTR